MARPKQSAFQQMKIPGCRLYRSPLCGLLCFLSLGVLFLALGIGQKTEADGLFKADIVYFKGGTTDDDAKKMENASTANEDFVFSADGKTCGFTSQNTIWANGTLKEPTWCEIDFEVKKDLTKNVFFYQKQDNFWQNNRIQMNNRCQTQLDGNNPQWQIDGAANSAIKACLPLVSVEKFKKKYNIKNLQSVSGKLLGEQQTMVPCGQSAASYFNIDQFKLYNVDAGETLVTWDEDGVIWPGFKSNGKYSNSKKENIKSGEWQDVQWTDINKSAFIEWMNPSSIRTQKVYAKIDAKDGGISLPKGKYKLRVRNTWELTKQVMSKKHFIISEENALGEKDNPMPIILIICGVLSLLSALPAYFGAKRSEQRAHKDN